MLQGEVAPLQRGEVSVASGTITPNVSDSPVDRWRLEHQEDGFVAQMKMALIPAFPVVG